MQEIFGDPADGVGTMDAGAEFSASATSMLVPSWLLLVPESLRRCM